MNKHFKILFAEAAVLVVPNYSLRIVADIRYRKLSQRKICFIERSPG